MFHIGPFKWLIVKGNVRQPPGLGNDAGQQNRLVIIFMPFWFSFYSRFVLLCIVPGKPGNPNPSIP
jgi:hypothetical protein